MKRMKTFLIYALLIVAFWIVTDIIIYILINGTYKPISTNIYISSPEVSVSESKATYVNGYIKGSIKNNTEDIINNKYLKIDMYSKRDVNLGTKYIKIDNLESNVVKDFELWYEFTDVDHVIITTAADDKNITEAEFSSPKITFYVLFGKLMLLYFM